MPDNIFRGSLGPREREIYGSNNWYDWSISHWGTKWNSYSNNCEGHTISFHTAWSAPHPVIERLAEMFPDVTITHKWADEDIGNNCGECVYADGVCVSEYYPDGDVESVNFACSIWECLPEERGVLLNSTEDEYINSSSSFDLIEICGKKALFTIDRLSSADIPKGTFKYDLRETDDGERFAAIEKYAIVNHGGTVILKEALDFGDKDCITLTKRTEPDFLGEQITFEEFLNEDEW